MAAMHRVSPAGPPPRARARRAATVAALVVLSALAATGQVALAQESTPAGATPTPQVTPPPDAPRLVVELREFNDSGITGTATLYDAGDQTIVVIDAENTGENHPSHIHAGRCDDLVPDVGYPLENVGQDGQATSVVDVSLDELLAGEFSVDMHLAPDQLGTLIACAEIEGEPTVPEGVATPPATPVEATPTAPPATPAETPTPTTPAETPTPAPTPEEAATPVTDGTGGAVNQDQNAASLPLFTTDDSGVTGTAVLTAQDNQTLVSIVLSGEAVTGGHIAHLHDGTCDAPGDVTLDLNPVGANGISETVVDIPLTNLLNDGYFINVHASEEVWDTWFVCANLTEATIGMVVPEVAPETGAAQPTPAPTTPTPAPTPVTTPAAVTGDGTAGLAGKGVPLGPTTALPQQAGVGTGLPWPTDPVVAIISASAIGAVILAACAWWIRRGERRHPDNPTRWTRLGI